MAECQLMYNVILIYGGGLVNGQYISSHPYAISPFTSARVTVRYRFQRCQVRSSARIHKSVGFRVSQPVRPAPEKVGQLDNSSTPPLLFVVEYAWTCAAHYCTKYSYSIDSIITWRSLNPTAAWCSFNVSESSHPGSTTLAIIMIGQVWGREESASREPQTVAA
jgi:hypothetical protein